MIPLFSTYNINDKYFTNLYHLYFLFGVLSHVSLCQFSLEYRCIIQYGDILTLFSYNSSTIVVINLTQPRIRKRTFHVASRICMYALNRIPLWVRVIQSSQKAVSLFVIGCFCNERRGLFLLFKVESCASRLLSAVHTATLQ